jgi:hypothetical protein
MLFPRHNRSGVAIAAHRRGSVPIFAAVSMSTLLGMADLATEYGYMLVLKVRDQRIADSAAMAGALIYSSSGSQTSMQSAAAAIGALNGLANSNTSASLTNSPRNDGDSAVLATVTTAYTDVLKQATYQDGGVSWAELNPQGTACIIALNPHLTGITMNGGTTFTVNGCSTASDASVTLSGSAHLYSDMVSWNTAAPTITGGAGIGSPDNKTVTVRQANTSDPFATNTAIAADRARLSTVSAETAPPTPSVSSGSTGNTFTFGYSSGTSPLGTGGCTATTSNYSGNWTVSCPAGGNFTFPNLSMAAGTVSFDASDTTATYNFSGSVNISQGTTTFGSGTFNFADGLTIANSATAIFGTGTFNVSNPLTVNGSSHVTFGSGTFNLAGGLNISGYTYASFGAGTFNIGATGAASCSVDGGTYSICNMSSYSSNGTVGVTIPGPSTVKLTNGVANGGGDSISIGAGSTSNSYWFGASSTGNAMWLGGGSTTTLANANGGLFEAVGNIYAPNGGNCLTLPSTANQDIKGNIYTAGGVTMGAGVYTVTGYVDIGGSNGGDVSCNGSQVGVSATNVTFVIGAASTPSDGCSGMAFCIGSGFQHVTLVAPTSSTNTNENLAVIGPASSTNTAGAALIEGAAGAVVNGLLYMPNGPVDLSGGASLSGGGGCLEIVGSQITATGGTSAATTCAGLTPANSSFAARLVQ